MKVALLECSSFVVALGLLNMSLFLSRYFPFSGETTDYAYNRVRAISECDGGSLSYSVML